MNFKSLLLGSAAVIASTAAAGAADLLAAEPVDYVRVCDAFGEGYWYIPGSDTCIAISGKVEVGVEWSNRSDDFFEDHDYNVYTSTDLNVDTRAMTDWGPLVAFIAMTQDFNGDGFPGDLDGVFELDEAYIQLGPLLMGFTQSVFDVQGGGYTDSGLDLSDNDVNQIQLSWAFNGFGLAIGIEDNAERYGSSAEDAPAVALALTGEWGAWEAGLSFLYSANDRDFDDNNDGDFDDDDDFDGGNTFAVEAVISTEIGIWQFQLAGIWNDGTGFDNDFAGDFGFTGKGGAVAVSSQQNWLENFYTAETFVWNDWDNSSGDWGAAFTVGYSPVDSLWFIGDAATVDEGDTWGFKVFAEKTFGPNG